MRKTSTFKSPPLRRWPVQYSLVLCILITGPSQAFKPANIGPGEIAMLPVYCIDTEGFMYGPENSPTQSPRAREWVTKMGRSFWTMHHYCWGLINLNRLRFGRANTNNKQYFAKQIVDEYRYVIDNSSPDFVLLPEIWARIGEASLLAGDIGGAMDAYAKSRSIKPDYAPAYTQWAEFQIKNNRRDTALAIVDEGLQKIPDSKPLLELRRKLGGGQAKDEARTSKAAAPAPKAPLPEAAASSVTKKSP